MSILFALACTLLFEPLGTAAGPAPVDPVPAADEPVLRSVEEEIVVTPSRSPQPRQEVAASVSNLQREEIAQRPANDLAEVLSTIPGIAVLLREPWAGEPIVSSRGFFGGGEAEYLRLLVDGLPAGDEESGLVRWRNLHARRLGTVEVLHGPASSLYGDAAIGGVVQVHESVPAPGSLAVALSGGSFETAAADVALAVPAGAGLLAATGAAWRTAGFRDGEARAAHLDLDWRRRTAAGDWSLGLIVDELERHDPGALGRADLSRDREAADPLLAGNREEDLRARVALGFDREESALPLHLRVYASYREGDDRRTLLLAPGFPDRARRQLETGTLGASLLTERAGTLAGGEARLRAGVETAYEQVLGQTEHLSPPAREETRIDGARERWALFATQDWHPWDRLRLVAGLRWDRLQDRFDGAGAARTHEAWSPRLGAVVTLAQGAAPASAYVQAGRAFKAPTLDQLFAERAFPLPGGGSFSLSNPELEPQRATYAEAGAWRSSARWRGQVAVYWMEVDDEIDFDVRTFRYLNIGRSRHQGVEVEVSGSESRRLVPRASWAWTRAEPLDGPDRGRQLKNVPEHQGTLGLSAKVGGGFTADLSWTVLAGRFLDDANAVPLDDVLRLDLRLRQDFGTWSPFLDLLNATGHEHSAYGFLLTDLAGAPAAFEVPEPGFGARLGVTLDLGRPRGAPAPDKAPAATTPAAARPTHPHGDTR